MVFSTNQVYLFRFYFDFVWKMEKYYEVDLFYSLDYMDELPIIHDDQFMVIINNSVKKPKKKEFLMEDVEDPRAVEPNVIIYRFEEDSQTSLFGALYETDIDSNPFDDQREESFHIVDSALNSEADGHTYLYLIMLAQSQQSDDSENRHNKLVLKKFHLGEYSLEYNLRSYRFRDTLEFVALDFYQNQISFTLEAVLSPNRDLYVFLFISSACLMIVVVMALIVVYKVWEYRRLKREVDERAAREPGELG